MGRLYVPTVVTTDGNYSRPGLDLLMHGFLIYAPSDEGGMFSAYRIDILTKENMFVPTKCILVYVQSPPLPRSSTNQLIISPPRFPNMMNVIGTKKLPLNHSHGAPLVDTLFLLVTDPSEISLWRNSMSEVNAHGRWYTWGGQYLVSKPLLGVGFKGDHNYPRIATHEIDDDGVLVQIVKTDEGGDRTSEPQPPPSAPPLPSYTPEDKTTVPEKKEAESTQVQGNEDSQKGQPTTGGTSSSRLQPRSYSMLQCKVKEQKAKPAKPKPNTDWASAISARLLKDVFASLYNATTPENNTHKASSEDPTSASDSKIQLSKLNPETSTQHLSHSSHQPQPETMGNSKSSSGKKANDSTGNTDDIPNNTSASLMEPIDNTRAADNMPKNASEVAAQLNSEVAKKLEENTCAEHQTGNTPINTPAPTTEPNHNTLSPGNMPKTASGAAQNPTVNTQASAKKPKNAPKAVKTATNDAVTSGNKPKKAAEAAEKADNSAGPSGKMPNNATYTPKNKPANASAAAKKPENGTEASDEMPKNEALPRFNLSQEDLRVIEQCMNGADNALDNGSLPFLLSKLIEAKDEAASDKVLQEWAKRPTLHPNPQLAALMEETGAKAPIAKPPANTHKVLAAMADRKNVRKMAHEWAQSVAVKKPELSTGEEMRALMVEVGEFMEDGDGGEA